MPAESVCVSVAGVFHLTRTPLAPLGTAEVAPLNVGGVSSNAGVADFSFVGPTLSTPASPSTTATTLNQYFLPPVRPSTLNDVEPGGATYFVPEFSAPDVSEN